MRRNLEIPQGKRTKAYRFFEILPGLISYGAIILLFILSWLDPVAGSIYLFIIIASTLVKAVSVAYRTVQGYEVIKRAERVDWRRRIEDLENPHAAYERLRDNHDKSYHFNEHIENLKFMATMDTEYPRPSKIYHVVIITAYNEGLEILKPSIEAVKKSTFPNDHIIVALAYEERGGETMAETAKILAGQYKDTFKAFLAIKHPDNLSGEVIGKGPNLTYAGEKIADYIKNKHLSVGNIIVTSLDSDNHIHEKYLDSVEVVFLKH